MTWARIARGGKKELHVVRDAESEDLCACFDDVCRELSECKPQCALWLLCFENRKSVVEGIEFLAKFVQVLRELVGHRLFSSFIKHKGELRHVSHKQELTRFQSFDHRWRLNLLYLCFPQH